MNTIKSLKLALSLGALATIAACTPNKSASLKSGNNSGIIGGEAVAQNDIIRKSTVSIVVNVLTQDNQQGQFLCTGSIIADNMILTAAHCIPGTEYKKAAMFVVFATDLNKMTKDQIKPVTGVVVHNQYGEGDARLRATIEKLKKAGNPNGDGVDLSDRDQGADNYDLAVIKIEGKVPADYQIANILKDETILKNGANVTLAGYGLTNVKKEQVDLKKYPDLDAAIASGQIACTYDKKTCYILTQENENILKKTDVGVIQPYGDTEVALDQSQGKGACHGDSGGPAFINVGGVEYLWGVTSRGTGKDGIDDCSNYAIYTKVNAEWNFISAAMKQLSTSVKEDVQTQEAPADSQEEAALDYEI
ncbi:S1 family peptidase [Bdellovibrio sp. HCB185ZH]|uniref:S1 family peptidase n=1 Tax=Bdellovibrio sp. HCB185ZH TaxID=3394235 RepID=UPI0039A48141